MIETLSNLDEIQKTYISSQKRAKIVCPQCLKYRVIDATNYIHLDRKVMVNVKCPCGNKFRTILEKRSQYRKKTNFVGLFKHMLGRQEIARGLMTVRDLSINGVKIEINDYYNICIDDRLQIEFHLDDSRRSLIQKSVIVKNINYPFIGTGFSPTENMDKVLGFFLFN